MTVPLICKCPSCVRGALTIAKSHSHIKVEFAGPIGSSCGRDRMIDVVMMPIHCVHCGSDKIDLGATGLHLCNDCGGLFREQDRVGVEAVRRQERIEEELR